MLQLHLNDNIYIQGGSYIRGQHGICTNNVHPKFMCPLWFPKAIQCKIVLQITNHKWIPRHNSLEQLSNWTSHSFQTKHWVFGSLGCLLKGRLFKIACTEYFKYSQVWIYRMASIIPQYFDGLLQKDVTPVPVAKSRNLCTKFHGDAIRKTGHQEAEMSYSF